MEDDFNFTEGTPQEQITALYVGILGRAPDPEGLNFWAVQEFTRATDDLGKSPEQAINDIAESIRASEEASATFGADQATDAAAVITAVTTNAFGREATQAELDSFSGDVQARLDDGVNLGDLIVDIVESAAGDDATTLNNRIDAGIAFSNQAASEDATIDEIVAAASDLNASVNVDTADPAQTGTDAADALSDAGDDDDGDDQQPSFDTVDLDTLGGTPSAPAEASAADGAVELLDNQATQSFTTVAGFGADDQIRLTNAAGDLAAEDVTVSAASGNTTIEFDDGAGTVSSIVLEGVDGFFVDVASFNDADVGDIVFNDEPGAGPDTEAPIIDAGQAITFTAGATDGDVLGTIAADDNTGVTGFSIVDDGQMGGVDSYVNVAADGTVTLNAAGAADEAFNDAATTPNSFDLTVTASDAAGNTSAETSVTLTVAEAPDVQTVDLDALGGTATAPASEDADGGAFDFTDDVGGQSFTEIASFGVDDEITLSGVTADDVDVSSSDGNTTIEFDDGAGTVSNITLLGVSGFFVDVASFNSADVGDITFA